MKIFFPLFFLFFFCSPASFFLKMNDHDDCADGKNDEDER